MLQKTEPFGRKYYDLLAIRKEVVAYKISLNHFSLAVLQFYKYCHLFEG